MLRMLEVIALILFAIVLIWPLIKAAVGNEEEDAVHKWNRRIYFDPNEEEQSNVTKNKD